MSGVTIVIVAGLLVLSAASGMLGLGVAFAAVPFLGFFMADLVHQVQPLSLFLNGVTALFAAFAPVGSWLDQYVAQGWLWGIYLLAVAYLAWQMFRRPRGEPDEPASPNLRLALLLAVPISVLAGLLGVGPGLCSSGSSGSSSS